ncbi:MAG: zinc ribbon domain-containing protein, partial [Methanomassiliicoccaceae archaeon]|nr:zinc ribbon domain-containing protein [Methanomassiliicoccaceae archaeon]
TVDNVSESMVGREAFIGLYKAGAGRSEPIVRKKLTKGENTVQLQLPDDIGGFEVRVIKDGTKPDETIAAKAKLTIKGLKCPSCGQENQTSLKGCAKCGATLLPGKCNECGYTDNPPGAEYCEICGAKRSA